MHLNLVQGTYDVLAGTAYYQLLEVGLQLDEGLVPSPQIFTLDKNFTGLRLFHLMSIMNNQDKRAFVPVIAAPSYVVSVDCFIKKMQEASLIVNFTTLYDKHINLPYFAKIFFEVFIGLFRLFSKQHKQFTADEQKLSEQPEKAIIKDTTFKCLLILICKQALRNEGSDWHDIVGMLFFRQQFLCYLMSMIINPNSLIYFESIIKLCNRLMLPQLLQTLTGRDLFNLYGGFIFKINRDSFEERLTELLQRLVKYLSDPNNFILKFVRSQSRESSLKVAPLIEKYLQILSYLRSYRAQQLSLKFSAMLFKDKTQLTKDQFQARVSKLRNQKPCLVIDWYIMILSIQARLLDSMSSLNTSSNNNQFYIQNFQKLIKKCPYNGDETCDCKKCQCIRRNRSSAKLNQAKKRQAVSLLGPLQSKVHILQERNRALEQQNLQLRKLVERLSREQSFTKTQQQD